MSLGLLRVIFLFFIISKQSLSEPLNMQYAKFKLLNKISNKIIEKNISVNGSEIMETLNINVYSCFSEPPYEVPENYVLVDIYDNFNENVKSIYTGWMISSSPDLTSLQHPIYDLWLLECNNDNTSSKL